MRRDMDLVREVLREAAESGGPFDASALADGSRPLADVAYQVELMRQAGLVEATVQRAWGGGPVVVRVDSLTWEGNDFLDAVGSDEVWRRVRARVSKTLGSVSFDVVKALAVRIASDMLLG